MARLVRINIVVVGKQSLVELADGEAIIAASSDGERASIVTAIDVTDVEAQRMRAAGAGASRPASTHSSAPGAPSVFASFSDG